MVCAKRPIHSNEALGNSIAAKPFDQWTQADCLRLMAESMLVRLEHGHNTIDIHHCLAHGLRATADRLDTFHAVTLAAIEQAACPSDENQLAFEAALKKLDSLPSPTQIDGYES